MLCQEAGNFVDPGCCTGAPGYVHDQSRDDIWELKTVELHGFTRGIE